MAAHQNSVFQWCLDVIATFRSRRHPHKLSSKVSQQPAITPSSSPTSERLTHRYRPSKILDKSNIPNIVWFEDALALHGSDTAVFDLFLLVPNSREAADVLIRDGYEETEIPSPFPNDERSCRGGIRLKLPTGSPENGTVLIDASVWHYDLQFKTDLDIAPLPPLNKYIESIMEYWLELSEEDYVKKCLWAMSLATQISYAYTIETPEGEAVRTEDFAQQLRPEFAELHYDMVGNYPRQSFIGSYRKHEYHAIRYQQIKEGTFTPRPYPTKNFPTSLAEYPDLTGLNAKGVSESKRGRRRKRAKKSVSISFCYITGLIY